MDDSPRADSPEAQASSYHHGDLRKALLGHALDLVRDEGLEALSLRAVARAAGVSQTAPYRHFANRQALVEAVAEDGFIRMGGTIERAVAMGVPGLGALRRGMRAYIDFALACPAEYRLMFGPESRIRTQDTPLAGAAAHAFRLLSGGIQRCQERGLLEQGDPVLRGVTAWATLHGLALLVLDGQAAAPGRSIDEIVDASIETLLRGFGGRS